MLRLFPNVLVYAQSKLLNLQFYECSKIICLLAFNMLPFCDSTLLFAKCNSSQVINDSLFPTISYSRYHYMFVAEIN